MRLKKLVISGHRSVKQEETLLVDDRVTILIGANDHGKSNILAALQCLNEERLIDTEDKNWDAEDTLNVEIRWHFSASEDDQVKLKKIGTKDMAAFLEKPPAPKGAVKVLATTEAVPSKEPTALDNLADYEIIEKNDTNEIVYARSLNANKVRVVSVPTTVLRSNESAVLSLRPQVELFESPSANLVDQVNLADLETPALEFMQGLFRLAGLWEDRKNVFVQNDKTSKSLEEASKRLTKTLNDRWNQGKELEWKLEHTGTNGDHIVIKIRDPAIKGRYTRPSLRSSGFRTYFLLSMIIYARTQNKETNSFIYLFDEPGTYLHPHAQLDLQRSLEAIADQAQILYTTHSLFLVSKNYPERNRVISKSKQGTKIDQKPFSKNWKSVRDSLGILLSNNFLIADKTLLVEGPSDIIYLLGAVKHLKHKQILDVDLNDFSIVDAGDEQNYVAMAKLMLSEGRSVVALLDGDNGGKKIEKQLKKVCQPEIQNKRLQLHLLPDDKSSEDMFANVSTLQKAISNTFTSLVDSGSRDMKPGLNIVAEVTKIVPTANTTLGAWLDKTSRTWFEPEEKMSKLSIALTYEDLAKVNEEVPEQAKLELEVLKGLLNLRGEKSVERGVFEEAPE